MKTILFRLSICFAAFCVFQCGQQEQQVINISPEEAQEVIRDNPKAFVLDVRTHEEYEGKTGHLQNARLVPMYEFKDRMAEFESLKSKNVFVVYCRSGRRSCQAAESLAARGFKVFNIDGGILRWNKEGLPVVREESKQ